MQEHINVLLVEDEAIIREALVLLIEGYDGNYQLSIIGEAEDGVQAIRSLLKLNPDLMFVDLQIPMLSGLEVIKEAKHRRPNTKIIALTSSKSEKDISDCLNAGVNGFVHKNVKKAELFYAIERVLAGEFYACSFSSMKVKRSGSNEFLRTSDTLSDRERQVLKLVAEGYKNKDISDDLFISIKTVEKHRANIKKKLNLDSTAELVAYCITENII